jgi:hypothetical protein
VTRRSLLGGALAGGGALLVPAPLRALAGEAGGRVFSMDLADAAPRADAAGGRWVAREPARAPGRFDLLGLEWAAPERTRIEVRTRGARGDWSPWTPAPWATGHGPDGAGPRRLTDPVWTGRARFFQVRSSAPLRGLRVHFVDSTGSGVRGLAQAARTRFVQTGLEAGPGQPAIIARSSWADPRTRPRHDPGYARVDLAVVHHTAGTNAYAPRQSAAIVRGIALFHRNVHGWNDIGYNFVVDRYGQIFEGRAGGIDEPSVGAHAGGYNLSSTGVAMLGTFAGLAPGERAFRALAHLLAWKLALHGVAVPGRTTVRVSPQGAPYSRWPAGASVTLNRITGHRDADTTACPGGALYGRLPRLRRLVRQLQGTVSELPAQLLSDTVHYPNPVVLSGALAAGGQPVEGATIELQRRAKAGQTTIATAVTNPDGTWTATAQLTELAMVRALFRGGDGLSAVVSAPVWVEIAPQIMLSGASPATTPGGVVQFAGTVTPVKDRVALVVAKQAIDGSFDEIRSIAVRPDGRGNFTRTVGFADPGRYQLVARTTDDRKNLAARSPAVEVLVAG